MNAPQIPYLDDSLVDKAVSHWRAGELVAIPTETVYGLAADATNATAAAAIFKAKSRPQFNPLIVHVTDAAMARRYAEWNAVAEQLAAAFWPGPLTLVLPRIAAVRGVHDLVTAGGDTVALRAPAHSVAQQLIHAFDGGLAAPSANRSGRVSPTTAAHVREEFGDRLLIIDGGPCHIGLESTVIDLSTGTPTILRPGSITHEMIHTVIPGLSRDPHLQHMTQVQIPGQARDDILKGPGQLKSHYAPTLPVRLNATQVATDEALLAFGMPLEGAGAMRNLSERGDLIEAAAHLFAHLRALDTSDHRAIAVMPIPHEGIGAAINDRLTRAAAPRTYP